MREQGKGEVEGGATVLDGGMPTVRLVPLPPTAMQALIDEDLILASEIVGLELPAGFVDDAWLWRIRIDQIAADPVSADWVARAVVADEVVVGHAGFHGPPDGRGMVEVAYVILPEFRGRGLAVAALAELLTRADAEPTVQVVRASISPDNAASLAVVRRFGFSPAGEQWDEEDGLELLFERPVPGGREPDFSLPTGESR